MKTAIALLLCAFVCTAVAYPSEKQALEDEIAQAELFNGLRNAVKNLRGKIRSKFGAIRNRICGTNPAVSPVPGSDSPAPASEMSDDDDAHIEALAEVLLQSMEDDAEMQKWWSTALGIGKAALPYVKTGLSLFGKK